MILHNNSPWPDAATARPFLAFLAGIADAFPDLPQNAAWQDALATWLIEKDVAALAAVRCREPFPSLAERLQAHLYDTAAENSLHWHNLKQINERFLEADLTAVLLKGAALAETVYDGPAQRAMADVDLWLAAQDMA
ncbi:MAG: nucleotidyltransferase family protein, partial [Candidatus Promineifilaceae bacterium]